MQVTGKWILAVLAVLIAPASAFAEIVTQIDPVFVPVTFSGAPAGASQYDTGPLAPGQLANFATAYDNLTFSQSGFLTAFTWIGTYEFTGVLDPRATNFRIGIYADAVGNQPGTQLVEYTAQPAIETPTTTPDFYQYTTAVTPFAVAAGTQYWLSIAAELPFDDNGFGWAYSDNGDLRSVQDFQRNSALPATVVDRFVDPIDYSFAAVTAVPEPSSCLLLAGALGTIGVRKWRARRRVAAK